MIFPEWPIFRGELLVFRECFGVFLLLGMFHSHPCFWLRVTRIDSNPINSALGMHAAFGATHYHQHRPAKQPSHEGHVEEWRACSLPVASYDSKTHVNQWNCRQNSRSGWYFIVVQQICDPFQLFIRYIFLQNWVCCSSSKIIWTSNHCSDW